MARSGEGIIRSRSNQYYKYLKTLQRPQQRHSERLFVVEGLRAVEDAIVGDARIDRLVLAERFDPGLLSHTALNLPRSRIADPLFDDLADTQHPQGVIAIVHVPERRDIDHAEPALLLVLDGIRDPGNLGTLLRSAAASDASGVVLTGYCVDYLNPKAVRAAMGAHFRVPVMVAPDEATLIAKFDVSQVVVCTGDAQTMYDEVDYRLPSAIIIGNEARGVSSQIASVANHLVTIPMHRETESLNAAVAGSIVLFEAERQRRVLN